MDYEGWARRGANALFEMMYAGDEMQRARDFRRPIYFRQPLVDSLEQPEDCLSQLAELVITHPESWEGLALSTIEILSPFAFETSMFMTALVSGLALPARHVLLQLNEKLLERVSREDLDDQVKANICILWRLLARHGAGTQSQELFSEKVCTCLQSLMKSQSPKLVQESLLALQSFAMTRANRSRIENHSEWRSLLLAQSTMRAPAATGNALQDIRNAASVAQIRFMATWWLNRLQLPHPDIGNKLTMQNYSQSSSILQSRDGFEARNMVDSFETLRCNVAVTSMGQAWYFEVTLLSDGIIQIGWSSACARFDPEEGNGVGDCAYSFAFDGCRMRLWHAGDYIGMDSNALWKPWTLGDTIGSLLDLRDSNRPNIQWFRNGTKCSEYVMETSVAMARLQDKSSRPGMTVGLAPSLSLSLDDHCRINVGQHPFRFPPKEVELASFQSKFKNYGLTSQATNADMIPRTQTSLPLCELCVSEEANIKLEPCMHQGMCETCSNRIQSCPFCRQNIDKRLILQQAG